MSLPVACRDVQSAIRRDPVISKVLRYTQKGWPATQLLKPFSQRKNEMYSCSYSIQTTGSYCEGATSRASRSDLDEGHSLKSSLVARSRQRPGVISQAVKQAPAVAPLYLWVWPSHPMQRIHIDFAGPILGKIYLLVVDAHSKWGEVFRITQTTATKTVEILRQLFSSYKLPEQVVSDYEQHHDLSLKNFISL